MDFGYVGFTLIMILFLNNVKALFKRKNKILYPLILCWFFCSFIVGSERTFFFWNGIIVMGIMSNYMSKNRIESKNFFENI